MPAKSDRMRSLPPYIFSVIGDRIKQMQSEGIDIIRLDIGSPDMPPPKNVVDKLQESAYDPSKHGYSGYRGIPMFRQAMAKYYKKRFSVDLHPDDQVLPLLGSKEGIINLMLAYVDRGDSVLVPDIGYPSYAMGTRLAGGEVEWMSLREDNGYLPDFSTISPEVASSAKLMWLNYPNNPTGAVADQNFYQQALNFCVKHDILLVSDNPYADVTYNGYTAGSALQAEGATEHAIEFFSLSKSHNMAGWRLGAAVGSASAIENLLHVKSNVDSGHFKPIYEAGAIALSETPQSWIDERNQIYQKRRDLILSALPQLGLEAQKPSASLYIWAKPTEVNVNQYVESALSDAHVSLAPGQAYGPGGQDFIRISVGVPDDRLEIALDKLRVWYADKAGVV